MKPRVRKRNDYLRLLPVTITDAQLAEMKKHAVCALTGSSEDVTVDHFIPLAWGHGGQYPGNVFFVKRSLNTLKSSLNPFKWINKAALREPVSLSNWDELVRRLAEQNGLGVKDFRRFVNWCEKHRRTAEQIAADPRPSLELWMASESE